MRISTKSIYESATNQLGTLQSALARTQQQLSTGRQNLTPADNPIASARALQVTQAQAMNTQMAANRNTAKSSLSLEEQALGSTTALIQDVQVLAVYAGNAGLNDRDRAGLATQLQGRLDDLVGLANTRDASGSYLFSGYQSGTPAFVAAATGATYQGDKGQVQLQVAGAQQMATSDAGSSVFGSDSVTTAGTPGIVSAGLVTNPAQMTGHSYAIDFSGTPGAMTYTVTDTTAVPPLVVGSPATPVVTPMPGAPNQQITFAGLQFDLTGTPANSDQVTVASKESLFTTLSNMISVLNTPVVGAAGQAALTAGLNGAQASLNGGLDQVLSVQTAVGTRLRQLDNLDSAGADLNLQYATTLSALQDVDTVAAISMFTQQQTTLDAAQKSFKALSSLSLFNYIG